MKLENKSLSEKNEFYINKIHALEDSEKNLKQKMSEINHKYDYLKNRFQELSRRCKELESQ